MTPKAVGSTPEANCHSGCVSRLPPPSAGGALGGTNGTRLEALTKNAPTTMTKRQTETLTTTSALVTHVDSWMPTMATAPEDEHDRRPRRG